MKNYRIGECTIRFIASPMTFSKIYGKWKDIFSKTRALTLSLLFDSIINSKTEVVKKVYANIYKTRISKNCNTR